MIQISKRLSLALAVAFALSLATATSASADHPFWFKSDGSPTTLNGPQAGGGHIFQVDAGKVTCNAVTFNGELVGETATTVRLNPSYSKCTAFGTLTATVKMNSCYYEHHTDTRTTNGPGVGDDVYHVDTTVKCSTPGDSISIVAENASSVVKCTIHIAEQNLGTGTTVTNSFSVNLGIFTWTRHTHYKNYKYSQTAGTGIGSCPNALNTSNGQYTGEDEIRGMNAAGGWTDIWLE